ncbi:MAG TPA: isoleucine--tRNA ligase, partial [Cytophagales bacterium]|nr:isoleucine--tRNA ligase [Cytophagales bacterium]
PHCWRTDKPVLYYPMESWFIKTTAFKDQLVKLNNTINWKPASTGTGRFGNWLENLVDWNLSRSRYWGTPLPIWRTEDGTEEICIGSVEELKAEVHKAKEAGIMDQELPEDFDLHRPYVDNIVLVSDSGKPMHREPDLIDVWFDSGAMPYAQLHYPFENKEVFDRNYPADFIAEGVDQTRGWFFTLHAIAGMLFDSVAFKNVIANGLVLDKDGNKMSKRLGNVINPFETIEQYGADATRWYLIVNANPWDNLKFDMNGVVEVQRRFFSTLQNTYSFFALYANLDRYNNEEHKVSYDELTRSDRWVLSKLNSLIKTVKEAYENYEPTRAARAIQNFTIDDLSNWYVRLNRKRFWKGEFNADKKAAYYTLHQCLSTIAQLSSPISPFYMDLLYLDLHPQSKENGEYSVHLSEFPEADEKMIDGDLEEQMALAQNISSLVHSLRKQHKIKVRQPLTKIMIPVLDAHLKRQIEAVEDLIISEVNVKEIEFVDTASGVIVKKAKPNFRNLGKQYGPKMKDITKVVAQLSQEDINQFETSGSLSIDAGGEKIELKDDDLLIASEDIPGWSVATENHITVALDITITEELEQEGLARDFVNRIQNLRKDKGLEVQDKISISVNKFDEKGEKALISNKSYICTETQARDLTIKEKVVGDILEIDHLTMTVAIEVVS